MCHRFSNTKYYYISVISLFLLSGCIGSNTAIFEYTLTPLAQPLDATGQVSDITIMLMPVQVPVQINDRGIVTRPDKAVIHTSSIHLWAGNLSDQINATLAENIRRMTVVKNVQQYPGLRYARPDILLNVEILRFDGTLHNQFTCSAVWTLSDTKNKKIVENMAFSTTVPVENENYAGYVNAASTALDLLGKDIGHSLYKIRELP